MHPSLTLLPLLLVAACASGGESLGRSGGTPPALILTSEVIGGTGDALGKAVVSQSSDGARVQLTVTGLPAGTYAVHLHAIGRCDTPAFTSAGGHFNPAMKQHGTLNPAGAHAGDLPNMTVTDDRRGSLDAMVAGLRLTGGDASLVDADGATIMVHASPDDYKTDPTGNAGARIACGVLAFGK